MLGNLAKVILITCGIGVFLFAEKWEWTLGEIVVRGSLLVAGIWSLVSIVKSYEDE